MSPEELQDIRLSREMIYDEDSRDVGELVDKLLAHIDQQTESIETLCNDLDPILLRLRKINREQAAEIRQYELVVESQLTAIDQQAKDIEALTALLADKAINGDCVINIRCGGQAAQIDLLKAALIEERAKDLYHNERCEYRTHYEFCDKIRGICDGWRWEECPIKNEWRKKARQQLAAEMPEVDYVKSP